MLKGKQKKLDMNKDGKLTKADFNLLRKRKRKTKPRTVGKKKAKTKTKTKTKRKTKPKRKMRGSYSTGY